MHWGPHTLVDDDWGLVVFPGSWDVDWLWLAGCLVLLLDWSGGRLGPGLVGLLGRLRLVGLLGRLGLGLVGLLRGLRFVCLLGRLGLVGLLWGLRFVSLFWRLGFGLVCWLLWLWWLVILGFWLRPISWLWCSRLVRWLAWWRVVGLLGRLGLVLRSWLGKWLICWLWLWFVHWLWSFCWLVCRLGGWGWLVNWGRLGRLIHLLQHWGLLVDVDGRMASIDDVGGLLGLLVRWLGLRGVVSWGLGGWGSIVGLLGGRLVAGLWLVHWLGRSISRLGGSIGWLLGCWRFVGWLGAGGSLVWSSSWLGGRGLVCWLGGLGGSVDWLLGGWGLVDWGGCAGRGVHGVGRGH